MDWLEEWWSSALGEGGFWCREQPGDHFRTSPHARNDPSVAAFTDILFGLLDEIAESRTRPALRGMVDLGAADGTLLREVAARRPDWSLQGVDVRAAPASLPANARWSRAVWDVRTTSWTDGRGRRTPAPWAGRLPGPVLVLAHEWLDDLPCRVARRVGDGWELLGPDGPTGTAPDAEEVRWLRAWAGQAEVAEVGLTRDRAWAAVAAGLPAGSVLVAVDYGHLRASRPVGGALLGYRDGHPVPPVPDGRTNITAPVAVDALAAAVEHVPGVRRLLLARQSALPVVRADDHHDDGPPLQRLVLANRHRALRDPDRWGANWWLVHVVDPTA